MPTRIIPNATETKLAFNKNIRAGKTDETKSKTRREFFLPILSTIGAAKKEKNNADIFDIVIKVVT